MKKKNGFTLIELLAVIVILAIIALIAVPQVLKILKQARQSAAVDTTYGIYNSVQDYVSKLFLNNGGDFPNEDLTFTCDTSGNCTLDNYADLVSSGYVLDEKLDYKGGKVKGGTITITDNGQRIDIYGLKVNGFTCEHNNEEASCDGLEHNTNSGGNNGGNSGNNGGNSGENNGEDNGQTACNPANAGNPKYFSLNDPTTSDTTNYQSLGTKMFLTLYEDNCTKGLCIIRNNTMECFKEKSHETEIPHLQQVFADVNCGSDEMWCGFNSRGYYYVRNDFQCSIWSTRENIGCGVVNVTNAGVSACRIIDSVGSCDM